jgi:hypothetical protein
MAERSMLFARLRIADPGAALEFTGDPRYGGPRLAIGDPADAVAIDLPADGHAAAVFLRRLAQAATDAADLAETHPALTDQGA